MIGATGSGANPASSLVRTGVQGPPPATAKQANWLPAPRGHFALLLRLYGPTEGALDGTWKPPAIRRE